MESDTQSLDLASWRAEASATFGTLRLTCPDPQNFRATVRSAEAGEISLFDMSTPPHVVDKRPEDITPTSPAYCKLSLQLEGASLLQQDDRELLLRPGEMALYVTQRPYHLEHLEKQRSLIVLSPQNFDCVLPQLTL